MGKRLFYKFSLTFMVVCFLFLSANGQSADSIQADWVSWQKEKLMLFKERYLELLLSENQKSWRELKMLNGKKDTTKLVLIVRHILFMLGDLVADSQQPQMDSSFNWGVTQYRIRNGLQQQGGFDKKFIQHLQRSTSSIIDIIDRNLIRLNSVELFSGWCLLVNIPDFKLSVLNNRQTLLNSDAIVGSRKKRTLSFNASLRTIVFNPYWNVPPGIFSEEIWPLIQKNPGYLKKHHMEWYGKTVRQLPGPDNPLGKVKFSFPNRYNIYMHDTPNKNLFKWQERTFSHGCIRLKDATALASLILIRKQGWTQVALDDILKEKNEMSITLNDPIAVRIVYLTAFVDDNEKLQLRKDIYRLDR